MATEPTNLTLHRTDRNVWDRQDREHSRSRTLSIFGLLLVAAGTALICQAYRAELAALRCRMQPALSKLRRGRDQINEAPGER